MGILSYGTREGLEFDKIASKRRDAITEDIRKADIFLSYSSRDAGKLGVAVGFFAQFGMTAYIDRGDHRLPSNVSPKTATTLRKRIALTPRFCVMHSDETAMSIWVPWELGIADGAVHRERIAILPMSSDGEDGDWSGQEYLGIYPKIEELDGSWIVSDPEDRQYWNLNDWLGNE